MPAYPELNNIPTCASLVSCNHMGLRNLNIKYSAHEQTFHFGEVSSSGRRVRLLLSKSHPRSFIFLCRCEEIV
jgi:hypothetical protein